MSDTKRTYTCGDMSMTASQWCEYLGLTWSSFYDAIMQAGSVETAVEMIVVFLSDPASQAQIQEALEAQRFY